jgi:hypothetical protein
MGESKQGVAYAQFCTMPFQYQNTILFHYPSNHIRNKLNKIKTCNNERKTKNVYPSCLSWFCTRGIVHTELKENRALSRTNDKTRNPWAVKVVFIKWMCLQERCFGILMHYKFMFSPTVLVILEQIGMFWSITQSKLLLVEMFLKRMINYPNKKI